MWTSKSRLRSGAAFTLLQWKLVIQENPTVCTFNLHTDWHLEASTFWNKLQCLLLFQKMLSSRFHHWLHHLLVLFLSMLAHFLLLYPFPAIFSKALCKWMLAIAWVSISQKRYLNINTEENVFLNVLLGNFPNAKRRSFLSLTRDFIIDTKQVLSPSERKQEFEPTLELLHLRFRPRACRAGFHTKNRATKEMSESSRSFQ